MPITIIKKRPTAPPAALEPLVNPRPPEPKVEAPRPAPVPKEAPAEKPRDYVKKPLAQSPEDHARDPNKYRSPPATACTFCGHSYSWPCGGKDPKCMNAKWVRDRQAKEGK